jgi:DNA-directed RNA polymerase subunit RPC12/RpoP
VWGNTLENKTQYMHCPQCGALHVYTILNFSASETGKYRCAECTRQELIIVEHNVCAYCGKNALPDNHLEVACPDVDPTNPAHFDPLGVPANTLQNLYFCKSHFRIAQRYVRGRGVIKKDLWKLIKYVCDQRMIQIARGNYKGTGGGGTRKMY